MRTFTATVRTRQMIKKFDALNDEIQKLGEQIDQRELQELTGFIEKQFTSGVSIQSILSVDTRSALHRRNDIGQGFYLKVQSLVAKYPGIFITGETRVNYAKKAIRQLRVGICFNNQASVLDQLSILEFLPFICPSSNGNKILDVIGDDRSTQFSIEIAPDNTVTLIANTLGSEALGSRTAFANIFTCLRHVHENIPSTQTGIVMFEQRAQAIEVLTQMQAAANPPTEAQVPTETPATENTTIAPPTESSSIVAFNQEAPINTADTEVKQDNQDLERHAEESHTDIHQTLESVADQLNQGHDNNLS